jgi:hypothetical protein
MSANTGTPASNEQAGGNLRDIDGIGPTIAKTLPKLGISNCAELAQYLAQHTAEELSELLAKRNVKIAAKKIENEDWLGQARERAAQASMEPATLRRGSKAAEEGEEIPNHPVNRLDEVRFGVIFKREKDRWTVTTYDERRNGPEKVWGIEPTEWANWILRQMRPHIELELAPPQAEAGAQREIEIEILDVQPSEAERFQKLTTKVRFKVSGSERDKVTAARTPFWIQVQTFDLVSKAANLVASKRSELEPEEFTYTRELEFPIPKVGHYELHTLVLLLPPAGRMALHQGPTLKVVP